MVDLADRIACHLNSGEICLADSCSFCGTDDRQVFRVQFDHGCRNYVNSDGIGTCQERIEWSGIAAPWPISFHADHCVHDRKGWFQQSRKFHEHLREGVVIDTAVEMPLNFSFPRDASEQVLYRAGQHGHAVGLEFRQIDDNIGLCRQPPYFKTAKPALIFPFHSLIEVHQLNTLFVDNVPNPGFFAYPFEIANAGAISNNCLPSCPLNDPDHCPHHFGMCRHSCFGRRSFQKVWFYEDSLPRLDE